MIWYKKWRCPCERAPSNARKFVCTCFKEAWGWDKPPLGLRDLSQNWYSPNCSILGLFFWCCIVRTMRKNSIGNKFIGGLQKSFIKLLSMYRHGGSCWRMKTGHRTRLEIEVKTGHRTRLEIKTQTHWNMARGSSQQVQVELFEIEVVSCFRNTLVGRPEFSVMWWSFDSVFLQAKLSCKLVSSEVTSCKIVIALLVCVRCYGCHIIFIIVKFLYCCIFKLKVL